MAYIRGYTFDNLSRIGNDSCDLSQRNVQNLDSANYMLANFFSTDCQMERPIAFATSQPNVFFKGGHQTGFGGCNIDTNSDLSIGSLNTHSKSKLSLLERPFRTVPYLGRGKVDPNVESLLLQGDSHQNKKSINNLTEQSFMAHSNYPLLPSLAATINNPVNYVEGAAADGWVRGGVPSRELIRDQEYLYK
jgi:hypothetical protein